MDVKNVVDWFISNEFSDFLFISDVERTLSENTESTTNKQLFTDFVNTVKDCENTEQVEEYFMEYVIYYTDAFEIFSIRPSNYRGINLSISGMGFEFIEDAVLYAVNRRITDVALKIWDLLHA